MGMFKSAASIILDAVYPRFCLLCNRQLLGESGPALYLCRSCAPNTEYTGEATCGVCGKKLISEKTICIRCRTRDYTFTRNVSLFSYTGTARRLLQSYKFEGYKDLAEYFAMELHRAAKTEFGGGNLPIVPVPSRKKRKKKQGWDHVERITRILHVRYGATILPLLARKGTRAQKTLSYEERLLNMKGSIVPAGTYKKPNDTVILLDDVFTTGATANECSFVLKQMGIKIVYVLTIAID